MNWTTIKNALHLWAETQTGISFAWADQDAPRLAYPYGTLKIMSSQGVGADEVRRTFNVGNDNLDTQVQGPRQFVLHLEAFSEDTGAAQPYIDTLRDSLRLPSVRAAFFTANIGVIRPETALDIGAIVGGENESRWGLDVQFAGSATITDTATDYVKTVEITGTVSGNNIDTFTVSDS